MSDNNITENKERKRDINAPHISKTENYRIESKNEGATLEYIVTFFGQDNDQETKTYFQTSTVDASALAKLVAAAQGKRTLNQFAEESKVYAPTLSRIKNGATIKRPLRPQIIGQIYDYAANKGTDDDNSVTLEKLMNANGFFLPDKIDDDNLGEDQRTDIAEAKRKAEAQKKADEEREKRREIEKEIIEKMKKTVQMNLWKKGYMVGQSEENFRIYLGKTDVYEVFNRGSDTSEIWYFKYLLDTENNVKWAERTIRLHANTFLQDLWNPEEGRKKRYSFVFSCAEFYKAFWDALKKHNAVVNNYFSTILVDTEKETVIREEQIPTIKNK